jgi:thioredoxin 2
VVLIPLPLFPFPFPPFPFRSYCADLHSSLFCETFATHRLLSVPGGIMSIIRCSKCETKNRVDPKSAETAMPKCGKCGTPLDMSRVVSDEENGKPIVVTDATIQGEIAKAGNKPVLVDAWAPWCGPCRIVGPIMDQLAAEAKGRYKIAKLNVDENPRTAAQYQISSIPTMLIFKNGTLVDRLVGAQPKQAIAAKLAQVS